MWAVLDWTTARGSLTDNLQANVLAGGIVCFGTVDYRLKKKKKKTAILVYRSYLIVPVNNSGLMLRVSININTGPERSVPDKDV